VVFVVREIEPFEFVFQVVNLMKYIICEKKIDSALVFSIDPG